MEKSETYLPEISYRMKAAADMVTKGNCVADIGCDHGYVSIYLYKKGIAKKCIASDINKGPLQAAKKNVELYDAGSGVEVRLSDGLSAFDIGEADTILITGMGGNLIEKILLNKRKVVISARELVLEPQSDYDRVRKCLCELGFEIAGEKLVSECGKYYPVIKAVNTGEKQTLSEIQYKFGPCILKEQEEIFREFLLKEKSRFEAILSSLEKKSAAPERREEIRKELDFIEEALNYRKQI